MIVCTKRLRASDLLVDLLECWRKTFELVDLLEAITRHGRIKTKGALPKLTL